MPFFGPTLIVVVLRWLLTDGIGGTTKSNDHDSLKLYWYTGYQNEQIIRILRVVLTAIIMDLCHHSSNVSASCTRRRHYLHDEWKEMLFLCCFLMSFCSFSLQYVGHIGFEHWFPNGTKCNEPTHSLYHCLLSTSRENIVLDHVG